MLLIACALAVGGYLYFRLDDEIRRQVERRIAEHYRDYEVRVRAARFDPDRGISITNLTLTQRAASGASTPVLAVEETYLAGKLRMDQLVTGQMPIEEIVVRGAKLRLIRQADGEWSARTLLPLPHFGQQSPRIKIEDASATIEDAASPSAKPWPINGINLQLAPADSLSSSDAPGKRLHLDGTVTGLPAQALRVSGDVDTTGGSFDLSIAAEGLEISPEMFAGLPIPSSAGLHGVELSGRADFTLKLGRQSADSAVGWAGSVKFDRGRIAHQSLPDPLTDVSLAGRADPQHVVIERLNGRCGSATFAVAADRAGWGPDAPTAVAAKLVGLTLDDRMRSALPESCTRIWDRFKPAGAVDAEVRLTFDGQKWRPVLAADCRGISLTDAEKFPYTLVQTTGRVEYRAADDSGPDRLRLDLTGLGAGRPVKIEAELTNLEHAEPEGVTTATGVATADDERTSQHAAGYRGVRYVGRQPASPAHPLGFVKISGTDIPIHEELLAALPAKAQAFTRSLHPEGMIDFAFRAEWKDVSQPRANVTQEIRLKDCRIQYARFPYPLQHVHGLASASNWHWTLEDILGRGVADAATIKCRGNVKPNGEGCDVDLVFNAQDVPLDDTLRNSLSPPGQQAWNELRPRGRIDFNAHVTRQAGEAEPIVEIDLAPRDKSVSIEPRMFPYRLEQIEGQAAYQRGHVDLRRVVAHHDRTVYSVESGTWQAGPDGGWQLALANLNADRLAFGRDLLTAVPPGLQRALDRFQPAGTLALYNSHLSFAKSPQNEQLAAAWDVNLECQQVAIQGCAPLRGVTGGLRLVGRSDGRSAVSAGEMAIDSMMWKDIQLTNVRGPLWTDGAQLLLGDPACRQQNQQPRRLTADVYGGSLAANIELMQGPNPSYKLDLHLGGASLARFANERRGGPKDMSGTVSGMLIVAGTGQTTQTLSGAGEMHVVDANMYQLPLLVSLIKVLNNRPPDTSAFNRCDMKFAVQGEHVHFEQLNLLGDAVSLYGSGDADLNRKLDLVFYSLIGPSDIPFWKTIAGHVSKQGLQLKVVGTLDEPKIERKAVPMVKDMLDHIQSELQEGAATMSPTTASRGPHALAR